MTAQVSPSTVPSTAADTPVPSGPAAPIAESTPRWKIDPRYWPPILVTLILLGGDASFGVLESWNKTGLAIGTAIATEAVLSRLVYKRWPHLASAYITGISVGMLVRSPYFWPYALCSAISIMSKYVLRVGNRHIWNPSNLGIVVMLALAPVAVASLSIQWGNAIWMPVVIWSIGFVILYRLRRLHISLTYAASFIGFAVVRTLITGNPFLAEVAPITGPMYQLFTLFMVTDPPTTVRSRNGQMLVVFIVALVECILRLAEVVHAPYYALFMVGPTALLVEMWRKGRLGGSGVAAK